jgi:hypothetical protein
MKILKLEKFLKIAKIQFFATLYVKNLIGIKSLPVQQEMIKAIIK